MRTFSRDSSRGESGAALAIFTVFMFSATVLAFFPGVYVKGYFDARSQTSAAALTVAVAVVAENTETILVDGEPTAVLDCDKIEGTARESWARVRTSLRTSGGMPLFRQAEPALIEASCVKPPKGSTVHTRARIEIVETYVGNEFTRWLGWAYDFSVFSEATVTATEI